MYYVLSGIWLLFVWLLGVGDTCIKEKNEDIKEDDCNGELDKEEEATSKRITSYWLPLCTINILLSNVFVLFLLVLESVIASKCSNINVSQSSNSFRLKSSKLDSSKLF